MNARRVRLWLWTMSAALLLSGVGGAVRLATAPLDQSATQGTWAQRAAATVTTGAETIPSLASLQAAWSLDLRRPLYDPPPVVETPKPPPAPPPLTVKLAGTIIEPGYSRALLSGADGKTQLRGVGEKVGDVEVIEIQPDAVTVLHNGSEVILELAGREEAKTP